MNMWKIFINIKLLGKIYNEVFYSDVVFFILLFRKKNVRILYFILLELC